MKRICAVALAALLLLAVSWALVPLVPLGVEIAYRQEESPPGQIQFYYASEGKTLSESRSQKLPLQRSQTGKLLFSVPARQLSIFRLDLDEAESLVVRGLSIRLFGVTLERYDAGDFETRFVPSEDLRLEREGEECRILSKGNDAYLLCTAPKGRVRAFCLAAPVLVAAALCALCARRMARSGIVERFYGRFHGQRAAALCGVLMFAAVLGLPTPMDRFRGGEGGQIENRALAEKPALTVDSLTEFPVRFEAYFNDHAAFRGGIIRFRNVLYLNLFHQSPVDKVILGRDGWLFYDSAADGHGESVGDYMRTNRFTEQELQKIARNLETVEEEMNRRGIRFCLMIGPNKSSVYGEYMPPAYRVADGPSRAEQMVEYLKENTGLCVVYPKGELLREKEQRPVYYKRDTHWNELGGFVGACALMRQVGGGSFALENLQYQVTDQAGKDLAGMLMAPLAEDGENIEVLVDGYSAYELEIESRRDEPYLYDRMVRSTNPNRKKLYLCGDSFGNAIYRPLGSQYTASRFVHTNVFDYGDLYAFEPDLFVYEIVERNLGDLLLPGGGLFVP